MANRFRVDPRSQRADFVYQRHRPKSRNLLVAGLLFGLRGHRIRFLIAAAVALILILALMLWVMRLLAARWWARIREQIACDLHDEVGANLSSVAHSTELIRELIPEPTDMRKELLGDTIQTALGTARDTRQLIRFLEQRDPGVELEDQFRKIALQILGPIQHSFKLNETRAFKQLRPIHQWDSLFFLKEALNNVLKHSRASEVEICTQKDGSLVQLIVSDNGRGIPPDRLPLRHLESQAKQLRGELTVESNFNRGTQVILTLTKRKWR